LIEHADVVNSFSSFSPCTGLFSVLNLKTEAHNNGILDSHGKKIGKMGKVQTVKTDPISLFLTKGD
jgi:hypothetical protein